jgi:hypothetical protein
MAVCMLKCLFFYYCLSLAHLFGIYFHPFTLQFAPHRISVYNVSRHLPSVNRTSLISRHSGPLCFVVYYLFLLHIAALYYAPPNESRLRGIEGNRKVGSKKWKASTQHVQSELSYCCLVFGLYLLALQNGWPTEDRRIKYKLKKTIMSEWEGSFDLPTLQCSACAVFFSVSILRAHKASTSTLHNTKATHRLCQPSSAILKIAE